MSLLIQEHAESLNHFDCLLWDVLLCRHLLTASDQMVQVRLRSCLLSEVQRKTLSGKKAVLILALLPFNLFFPIPHPPRFDQSNILDHQTSVTCGPVVQLDVLAKTTFKN